MNELYENITKLNTMIDNLAVILVRDQQPDINSLLLSISPQLSTTFPLIIQLYQLDEMSEYAGDRQYWVDQLSRIMDAFERRDRFAIVDVLKYETKANLEEVQRIMTEKGLADRVK